MNGHRFDARQLPLCHRHPRLARGAQVLALLSDTETECTLRAVRSGRLSAVPEAVLQFTGGSPTAARDVVQVVFAERAWLRRAGAWS